MVYSTTVLTLKNCCNFEYDLTILYKVKCVSRIATIHHLDISETHTSIFILTKIMYLLPILNTVNISSLFWDYTRITTTEELDIMRSVKDQNKITKVYLKKIHDTLDFPFITLLCPYVIHFKVKSVDNINTQSFLRTIQNKTNDRKTCYIRSLCFYASVENAQIIDNLRQMIQHKQLLGHFIIKHVVDNIYLQWN